MAAKSKLTVAAEIATIVGAVMGTVGASIAWLAYRDTHQSPSMAPNTEVAVVIVSRWAAYCFIASLIFALTASILFFVANRSLQKSSRLLKNCKDDLADSANRNLEYRAKIASLLSDLVLDSDPKVYPQFVDDRPNGSDRRELQAYFTIVNRSDSEARNIVLDPIEMHGKVVQFTRHRLAAPLLPYREVSFFPDVVTKDNESTAGWGQDLFHLFYMDYTNLGDATICEATKSVRATYQDSLQNLFEVTCELVFDPSAHNSVRIGNRGPNPAIFTRNHKFRKIARAI